MRNNHRDRKNHRVKAKTKVKRKKNQSKKAGVTNLTIHRSTWRMFDPRKEVNQNRSSDSRETDKRMGHRAVGTNTNTINLTYTPEELNNLR